MSAATLKPTALTVIPEGIPDELKALDRWVVWRWTWKENEGKWDKPPYKAKTGKLASTTGPATWSSFATALAAYERDSWDGIGVVLTNDDDISGVDLDHCINNGEIDPEVLSDVRALNSYTEVSPSGTGLRVICHAKKPPGNCRKEHFEIYETGRYLTLTGHRLDGATINIEYRQEQVEAFHAKRIATPTTGTHTGASAAGNGSSKLTDSEVLDLARKADNAAKFNALYNGDNSLHNDDASVADLALCSMLAYWTGRDPAQINRLFCGSRRVRDKWDETHGAQTYGDMTVAKAIAMTTEVYEPPPPVTVLREPPGNGRGHGEHTDEKGDTPPEPERRRIKILSLDDLRDMPLVEFVVAGTVQAAEITLLYGPPKTAKSLVALDIALHVAAGISWRGRSVKSGHVVYVALENTSAVLNRVSAWVSANPGAKAAVEKKFHVITYPVRANSKDYDDLCVAINEDIPEIPTLVVVDTMARYATGRDENSSRDMGEVLGFMDKLKTQYGTAVLIVHHAGKDTARGARGSNVFTGSPTTVLQTSKSAESRLVDLRCTECNNAADGWRESWQIAVTFDFDPFYGTPYLYPVLSADAQEERKRGAADEVVAIVTEEPGIVRTKLRDRVAGARDKTEQAIDEACRLGLIVERPGDRKARTYWLPALSETLSNDYADETCPTEHAAAGRRHAVDKRVSAGQQHADSIGGPPQLEHAGMPPPLRGGVPAYSAGMPAYSADESSVPTLGEWRRGLGPCSECGHSASWLDPRGRPLHRDGCPI